MRAKKHHTVIFCLGILALQGFVLWGMGRNIAYPWGDMKVWDGSIKTPENSQHLFDWYSSIHLVYGIVGYYVFRWVNKKWGWPLTICFLALVAVSAAWEIYENTPYFIHAYNTQANATYYGDSIVNSMWDTAGVALGFVMAYTLPVWLVILVAVTLEILTNVLIGDGVVWSTLVFFSPLASLLDSLNSP